MIANRHSGSTHSVNRKYGGSGQLHASQAAGEADPLTRT
jgi:hypothetical protein